MVKLLMNILSVRVADVAVLRVWLAICGITRDEYIESMKFEISLFV